jgi:hypothetical protein
VSFYQEHHSEIRLASKHLFTPGKEGSFCEANKDAEDFFHKNNEPMTMMEDGLFTEIKHPSLIKTMVQKLVRPKGFEIVKANVEGYEPPARLKRKGEDEGFIPDATGTINGKKSYFELALKTEKISDLVTKWKLMSNLAQFRGGKLYLVAPKGHVAFTNRLLKDYPIQAKLVKI